MAYIYVPILHGFTETFFSDFHEILRSWNRELKATHRTFRGCRADIFETQTNSRRLRILFSVSLVEDAKIYVDECLIFKRVS